MNDDLLSRVLSKATTVSYRRRSLAYRWLREAHAQLSPVLNKLDPAFGEIAKEMAAGGITGGRGHPLTAKSLMTIWDRVCRDIQAEAKALREAKAEEEASRNARRVNPSRLPASWKPMPAELAEPTPAPRYAPPNTVSARTAPIELSEEARATLAALDRQLDHRDRFVNPPKRKD